jgi:hypothetical protein
VQRVHVDLTVASAWPGGRRRRRIGLWRRARRLGLAQAATVHRWPSGDGQRKGEARPGLRARRMGLNRGHRFGVPCPDAEAWRRRTPVESRGGRCVPLA